MNKDFIDKILIIIIIFISFFIIYNLKIYIEKSNSYKETFQELKTFKHIKNSENLELPLKQYIIMSSWNSCLDSSGKISTDQLKDVFNHGCRFIDLEVYLINNIPMVAYSSSNSFEKIESNQLLLLDVCKTIALNAFSTPTPNPNDPLFVHFRIKSKKHDIFEKIAECLIGSGMHNKIYEHDVSKETILKELSGKIVIVVDKSYVPEIETNSCRNSCNTDLVEWINIYSSTNDLQNFKINQQCEQQSTPLQIQDSQKKTTNIDSLKMVNLNDIISSNFNKLFELIKNHSVQIVPYKFNKKDRALNVYEEFFSDNGKRAFVPFYNVFNYF
jgi:hypothetical protein